MLSHRLHRSSPVFTDPGRCRRAAGPRRPLKPHRRHDSVSCGAQRFAPKMAGPGSCQAVWPCSSGRTARKTAACVGSDSPPLPQLVHARCRHVPLPLAQPASPSGPWCRVSEVIERFCPPRSRPPRATGRAAHLASLTLAPFRARPSRLARPGLSSPTTILSYPTNCDLTSAASANAWRITSSGTSTSAPTATKLSGRFAAFQLQS
jgi:hypothetical protein